MSVNMLGPTATKLLTVLRRKIMLNRWTTYYALTKTSAVILRANSREHSQIIALADTPIALEHPEDGFGTISFGRVAKFIGIANAWDVLALAIDLQRGKRVA